MSDEKRTRVAIPSMAPGGLDSQRSSHFGRCDCFTLVNLVDGVPESVDVVENLPHQQGGCMGPVNLLKDAGAQILLTGGMGMRPLMGFRQVGIEVYLDATNPMVGAAVNAFTRGELLPMDDAQVCGG